jgi:hypothetical protein
VLTLAQGRYKDRDRYYTFSYSSPSIKQAIKHPTKIQTSDDWPFDSPFDGRQFPPHWPLTEETK